jgi:hypothetical protein
MALAINECKQAISLIDLNLAPRPMPSHRAPPQNPHFSHSASRAKSTSTLISTHGAPHASTTKGTMMSWSKFQPQSPRLTNKWMTIYVMR